MIDSGQQSHDASRSDVRLRHVQASLLTLAVFSALVLGPLGPVGYAAGLVNSFLILVLASVLGLILWLALLIGGFVYSLEALLTGRKKRAVAWLGLVAGILLSVALQLMGVTPSPIATFAQGVAGSVELRTDIDDIQVWVTSMGPDDVGGEPLNPYRSLRLPREDQPDVLRRQNGIVTLELDAGGRPRVRLRWGGGLIGHWGIMIGRKATETPPPEPEPYREMRIAIRPGVYFWRMEG